MRLRDLFGRPFSLSLVWALLPFALMGGGFALLPLRSWDYWWHIAFGRVISHTHEMPIYAHFLYIMPADAPSYVQAWLSQWALYDLHEWLGMHGILIIRNFFAAIAYTLLGWWAARRSGSVMLGALLSLAGAVFGFLCIAARTHLLAWPFFLLLLPLAYRIRSGKWPLWLVAVFPPMSVLWTNLHGTFLVPTLICGAFAAAALGDRFLGPRTFSGRQFGAWMGAGALSLLATLVNPRGWEVYVYLYDLPTNPENLATVTEWFPTTPMYPPFYGAFFWGTLLATLGAMWWQRHRIDLADLVLLLGFSALAIRHSRALLWYGLLLPVVAAGYVRPLAAKLSSEDEEVALPAEIVNVVIAATLVVIPFALQPWDGSNDLGAEMQVGEARTEPPLKGLVTSETPVEAALEMREWDETPRIFHDHRYPGFLLYMLQDETPERMVYLDNRVELPSAEDWRTYDRVSRGKGWREVFEKFDVNAVVASTQMQSALIDELRSATDWELVFENADYAFFVK